MAISIINPVLGGGTLTDGFGWRPAIPSIGLPAMLHDAQDIAAPLGTPLYAGHDGTVTMVTWSDAGGGWGVQITHPEGWSTQYWHMLQEGRPKVGAKVTRGKTRIGSVGNSGKYTVGPHVHYSLISKGKYIDPKPYMSGLPTPNVNTKPSEGQEEDDEMKNCGFYYTRKQDGAIVYLIINFGSGAYHEYTNGGRGKSMPGTYNNPVAAALGTGSYASVTEGHAKVMKEAADKVRQGK